MWCVLNLARHHIITTLGSMLGASSPSWHLGGQRITKLCFEFSLHPTSLAQISLMICDLNDWFFCDMSHWLPACCPISFSLCCCKLWLSSSVMQCCCKCIKSVVTLAQPTVQQSHSAHISNELHSYLQSYMQYHNITLVPQWFFYIIHTQFLIWMTCRCEKNWCNERHRISQYKGQY